MADEVLYAVADGIATITLNRPERRNALNTALMDALSRRFGALESDTSVRAVVIRGAGQAFCSGRDLNEMSRRQDDGLEPEAYAIPPEAAAALKAARARGGRIVAVGTTVVRTLETAALALTDEERARGEAVHAGSGESALLIVPGHEFRAVDALVTNFHLPRSTLLLLVSAFMGKQLMEEVYQEAIRERYRFFSFGDAMLLL